MDERMKREIIREAISWVKVVAFAVIFALIITNFVIVNAKVPTASMETTIMTNDRLVAFRLSYLFNDPERYDIVVFPAPDEPETLYVKRIMGLPGETLEMRDGEVYINGSGEPLRSDFVNGELTGDFGPVDIPEGCYFMLGDNRNNSRDAREWTNKFVGRETILGKIIFRYFPIGEGFIVE